MLIPAQNLKLVNGRLKAELEASIAEVMDTQCFVLGPKLEEFEAKFASLCQTSHCIGVGNGTDALMMSLWALGVGKDDEVILPSFTFMATAHAVALLGAKPVFVDVNLHDYTMDVEELNWAITPRTKAIIPVNLFGYPCDYDRLDELTTAKCIPIVEDNAQAQGAKYKNKACGGIGLINATSFYPTKNLGAMGDGGAITTNNHKLAKLITEYRNLGMRKPGIAQVAGRNSRLDELQAAILLVKLSHLKQMNEERAKIASWYTDKLSHLSEDLNLPEYSPDNTPVWHHYVIRTDNRDMLRSYLKSYGIDSAVYYSLPCHMQKPYQDFVIKELQNTEYLATKVLALPCYPGLTEKEIDYVCSTISAYFRRSA